jgi:voltage-gated potassium channel
MPILLFNTLRAIWGLRNDSQFGGLALLVVVAIASGTGFYSIVEGLRFVDALYFSVITLTTVGYGDFAPETDAGKLFTSAYVLVGIGILAAFVTRLAAEMARTPALPHRPSHQHAGDGAPAADPRPEAC